MRVAVISDIHANLHALEAVAEAIERRRPTRSGVSATSSATGRSRTRAAPGSPPARRSAWPATTTSACSASSTWTILARRGGRCRVDARHAAADARAYLETLSSSAEREGVRLYHASPRDPVWEYVLTWEAARDAIDGLRAPSSPSSATATFRSRSSTARGSIGGHAAGGTELDLVGGRWLLNPGSVGQPRDGDPNAAWLLLDLGAKHASFRRVALRRRPDPGRDQGAGTAGCAGGTPRVRRVAVARSRRLRRGRGRGAAAGADRAPPRPARRPRRCGSGLRRAARPGDDRRRQPAARCRGLSRSRCSRTRTGLRLPARGRPPARSPRGCGPRRARSSLRPRTAPTPSRT